MLLRPKLIVFNISMCNATGNIPNPGTNFSIQVYKEIIFYANPIKLNNVSSKKNFMIFELSVL